MNENLNKINNKINQDDKINNNDKNNQNKNILNGALVTHKIKSESKSNINYDHDEANQSEKSYKSDHTPKNKNINKNVRSVCANRKSYTSIMNPKDMEQMDDMELFAVIDTQFIQNIDLEAQMIDFPRIS